MNESLRINETCLFFSVNICFYVYCIIVLFDVIGGCIVLNVILL